MELRTLHIVRHASVTIEPEIPSADWRLTGSAEHVVRRLASQYIKTTPTRVVSSRQSKAVETAQIIAASLGVGVEIRAGLEEHHRENEAFIVGDIEFRARLKRFFDHPDELVFGSETANQALERFERAISALMADGHREEVVVTHGTVMSLFLGTQSGNPFEIWRDLATPDYRAVIWPLSA